MTNKLILPRIYMNEGGKYPQFVGRPKISYSQYTSWNEAQYKPDYIVQYFSGIKQEAGIWANFGNNVGDYISHKAEGKEIICEMLSNEDKLFLDGLDYPENCVYEDEIIIECDGFVIQAFTDRTEHIDDTTVGILDYKTGNTAAKKDYYGGDSYHQTALYSIGKEREGKSIAYSKVHILGRKGNGTPKYPIRLSGELLEVDTPYTRERGEKIIADITKTAKEISDLYKCYKKYFS